MSAVPVLDITTPVEPRIRPQNRTVPTPRPVIEIVPRPKVVVAPRRKPSIAAKVGAKCALFAGLTCMTYALSALTGQVLVEKARGEGIRAVQRTRMAESAEVGLRAKLDELQRADKIEDWALSHGFVAPLTTTGPAAGAAAKASGSDRELLADNRD